MLRLSAILAFVNGRRDAHRLGRDGDHHDRHQHQRHHYREFTVDGYYSRYRRHPRPAIFRYYLSSADDRPQYRRFFSRRPRSQGEE